MKRSFAQALGREFVRVALGGVHDEAELRGHRRTYVGARPGRIVRALTEAGTMNPVIAARRGRQAGRRLARRPVVGAARGARPGAEPHVPRPLPRGRPRPVGRAVPRDRQRARDHPRPAAGPAGGRSASTATPRTRRSRIARDHLLARQLERNGLTADDVTVTDDALRRVVIDYTREAGVRHLERELGKLLRKTAARDRVGRRRRRRSSIDADDVAPALGRAKFYAEVAERTSVPGVATGLAVTGVGGDVLFIEATAMDGDAA